MDGCLQMGYTCTSIALFTQAWQFEKGKMIANSWTFGVPLVPLQCQSCAIRNRSCDSEMPRKWPSLGNGLILGSYPHWDDPPGSGYMLHGSPHESKVGYNWKKNSYKSTNPAYHNSLQCGAPNIAKLVYNFITLTTIVYDTYTGTSLS